MSKYLNLVYCLVNGVLLQTRSRISGTVEDRISIENLYKFIGFGEKQVIRKFPDTG